MKLFPILIAVCALGVPLALWASSSHRGGLFTDRADEAAPNVALAPGPAGYAAR